MTKPKEFCSRYPISISMSNMTENLGLITNTGGISPILSTELWEKSFNLIFFELGKEGTKVYFAG